jgi:cytochrome c oxidase subunit IV
VLYTLTYDSNIRISSYDTVTKSNIIIKIIFVYHFLKALSSDCLTISYRRCKKIHVDLRKSKSIDWIIIGAKVTSTANMVVNPFLHIKYDRKKTAYICSYKPSYILVFIKYLWFYVERKKLHHHEKFYGT